MVVCENQRASNILLSIMQVSKFQILNEAILNKNLIEYSKLSVSIRIPFKNLFLLRNRSLTYQ